MNLPLIGRLDIKTAIITILFVMYALPFLMGLVGRRKSGTAAA